MTLLLFLGDLLAPDRDALEAAHFRWQAVEDRCRLRKLRGVLPGSGEGRNIERTRELDALAEIVIVLAGVELPMEFQRRLDEPLRLGVAFQAGGDHRREHQL